MKKFIFSIVFIFSITAMFAQNDDSKKGYHLFNPTPRDKMREFSIDRPDVTESPNSLDGGHFQFEGDIVRWEKYQKNNSPTQVSYWNGLYKLGLTNKLDIHFGIELYNTYQDVDGKTFEKGYGNTTIRLKYNFWGNEGDTKTALGVIPYVTLPTSALDDDVAFGVGFPFSVGLTDALDFGAQFQGDFARNEMDEVDFGYLQTVVIGGGLIGNLDFFAEFAGIFSQEDPIFTLNGGLIYNVTPNVKIDIAGNYGLVDAAYSTAFLGLSFRY
jgi:opacity protein-like surface antigen